MREEEETLFGKILIDFKLKDGSTRRIYNIQEITDWNIIKHLSNWKKNNLSGYNQLQWEERL